MSKTKGFLRRLNRSRLYRFLLKNAGLSAKLTMAYSGTVGFTVAVVGLIFFITLWPALDRIAEDTALERAESVTEFLEYAALLENEASLRARVESAQLFAENIPGSDMDAPASLSEVRSVLERYLLIQKIGERGYFYTLTGDGVVLFHPDTELIGQNLSEEPFVREILDSPSEFVIYSWKREFENEERYKTAYSEWNERLQLYLVASDYSEGLFERIPRERLASILETVQGSEMTAVVIRNDSGEIKAASSGYARLKDIPNLTGPIERIDGNHLLVRMPLERYGMVTEFFYDISGFLSFARYIRFSIVILIVTTIIAATVTSRIAAKAITSPLKRAVAFLSQGNLSIPETEDRWHGDDLGELLRNHHSLVYRLHRERHRREETERRLLISESAFINTNEGLCVTDREGTILRVNPAFERITGYSSDEAVGNNPRILKSQRHSDDFYAGMWERLVSDGAWSGEIWNKAKDGTVYPELLTINRIDDGRHGTSSYVAVFHDITEMRAIQDKIRHMANHDGLTGLPNRSYLDAVLDHAIHRGDRREKRLALMFIDIDNFKDVNDSLGHSTGDLLLQWVAEGISSLLRADDVVTRFGGDEFVVVIDDVEDQDQVSAIAKRILTTVNRSFRAGEHVVRPSASIGIAFYPDSASNAESLLRNADAAMYEAKKGEKNDYRFHDPEMNVNAHRRLAMQGRILTAIESGEMDCLFQPIYSLPESRIVGAEALVRWKKGGTLIPPDQFLPYIENTASITKLDLWIAERALSAVSASGILPDDFYVSVNAAPIDLITPGFVKSICGVIARTGSSPNRVRMEITETAAVKEFKRVNKTLGKLRDAGFQIYIDDFGEGHSSIRYLREFGVNAVKLDKVYIMDLENSDEARSLVTGFIQLAHGIGLQAIVEGVEEESQLRFLEAAGADFIQGYLIGAPMPLRDLERRVDEAAGS